MPRCLLTNPVVNQNLLAKDLVSRGVECFALIEMDKVHQLSIGAKSQEREFDASLFNEIYLSTDDLPGPGTSPFDAVIAGGEPGVELADIVSHYYGLAGNDPGSTKYRRNKDAMQARLKEVGLPHIKTVAIVEGDSLEMVTKIIPDGPYILKPSDAAGGEALRFCRTSEELAMAIRAIEWGAFNCTWKRNERFLVQEYIPGSEYGVDLVARKGKIVVSALTRYVRLSDMGYWSHPNVLRFIVVDDPEDPKFKPVIDMAVQCCEALGIRQGAAHMELLSGPNGLHMVEVGARLHGSLTPQMFARCYENDLLTSLYHAFFCSGDVLRPGRLVKHGLRSFILAEHGGVLGQFDRSEQNWLQNCDSLVASSLAYEVGEQFPKTVNGVSNPASGFFANSDVDCLFQDVWKFDQILHRHFIGKPYEPADLANWIGRPRELALREKIELTAN